MISTVFLSVIGSQGGWTVAIVGYTIVFMALVMLFFIFSQLPRLINMRLRSEQRRKGKQVTDKHDEFHVEGNVSAAISMALHLYFNEMHDDEPNVITIDRIQKRYSPWSSKIYNIYNSPVKK